MENNQFLQKEEFTKGIFHNSTENKTHLNSYENQLDMNFSSSEKGDSIDKKNVNEFFIPKKPLTIDKEENIKKFIVGKEIVDKKNPFRSSCDEKCLELANALPEDFISKEEILKQSKYVPVYIRNPDRELTYDKTILEKLSLKTSTSIIKQAPKIKVVSNIQNDKKTKNLLELAKYPDFSDIKVRYFYIFFIDMFMIIFNVSKMMFKKF